MSIVSPSRNALVDSLYHQDTALGGRRRRGRRRWRRKRKRAGRGTNNAKVSCT